MAHLDSVIFILILRHATFIRFLFTFLSAFFGNRVPCLKSIYVATFPISIQVYTTAQLNSEI